MEVVARGRSITAVAAVLHQAVHAAVLGVDGLGFAFDGHVELEFYRVPGLQRRKECPGGSTAYGKAYFVRGEEIGGR